MVNRSIGSEKVQLLYSFCTHIVWCYRAHPANGRTLSNILTAFTVIYWLSLSTREYSPCYWTSPDAAQTANAVCLPDPWRAQTQRNHFPRRRSLSSVFVCTTNHGWIHDQGKHKNWEAKSSRWPKGWTQRLWR